MSNTNQVTVNGMRTLPARVHASQAEKVERVIKKTGESQAEFVRRAIASQVAADLNEQVEALPPVVRGRGANPISQAAKLCGLSAKEFLAEAGKLIAMQALGQPVKLDERMEELLTKPEARHAKQPSQSGTMRAVHVGRPRKAG